MDTAKRTPTSSCSDRKSHHFSQEMNREGAGALQLAIEDDEVPTADELDDNASQPASRLTPLEVEMQPLHPSGEEEENGVPVKGKVIHYATWEDWLYPPHLPRECQLLRRENLAVPACYLLVGVLQGLSSPLVNVLPLDLGATEAQQTTLSSVKSLPASFKILFGFLSDNVAWNGYRRKPYMFFGWMMASVSLAMLLFFSNLNIAPRNAGCFKSQSDADINSSVIDDADSGIPADAPSIAFLSVAFLGFGTGFWMADVMGDSIVAEKAKLEPPEARGSVQSSCYAYRYVSRF